MNIKYIPWQLSMSVLSPVHGRPSLWVRDRDLDPCPQLVEHDPHASQLAHDPSTEILGMKIYLTKMTWLS